MDQGSGGDWGMGPATAASGILFFFCFGTPGLVAWVFDWLG